MARSKSQGPRCVTVQVDGQPVLAQFMGEPTQADIDALREVIRAARRRYEQEHPSESAE